MNQQKLHSTGRKPQGFSSKFDEHLVDNYKRNFDRFVKANSRSLGGVENAEDCTQMAYLRALENKNRMLNFEHFDKWFQTLFSNNYKNFKKHLLRRREDTLSIEDFKLEYEDNFDTLGITKIFTKYLERVKPLNRDVLWEYYILAKTPSEISLKYNVGRRWVTDTVKNFRNAFRRDCAHMFEDGD